MISTTCFFLFIAFHLSYSLQTNYTCEPSVKLTCPKSSIIVILEATYSSECSKESNGLSIYPPSRCIGYYRERISTQCNGKETCTVDNSLEQRPSFLAGKQANCAFKGQSVNIEYSCVPDFYESKQLPSIDICSLKTLDGVKEGFIHSPNYPNQYPNDVKCTKTIPTPETRNRLKIFVLDFDIESIRVTRLTSKTQINDWLEINDNGDKVYGTRAPYTLLFDDVIEASLTFKSDSTNSKKEYHGFLLYFVVTPIRPSRPILTTTGSIDQKSAALFKEKQQKSQSNIGLILLVILLSSILVVVITGLLLYKRRNDRRIRYLADTFNTFIPKRQKTATIDSPEKCYEVKLSSSSSKDEHIYSQDPLDKEYNEDALLYECIADEPMTYPWKSIGKPV